MKLVQTEEERKAYPVLGYQVAVVLSLIVLSGGVGFFFHSVLKTDIIYTHFIYIPIVVAGMWWGRKGIYVAFALAAMIITYHLLGIAKCPVWHDLIRMLFFIIVSLCISRLRRLAVHGQHALALSERKYQLLVEDSLTGVIVYTSDRVVFANRRIKDILGYDEDEIVHKSVWELFHHEDAKKVLALLQEKKGGGDLHYQCRFLKKNGGVVWADVSRNETIYEGKPAVLMNIYDITRRKEIEKKKKELSVLAKRQEEQLVHSYRLIELGEMAAAISHELNQPLTGIQNYAKNAIYMLDHNIEGPEKVRRNLMLISDQVTRASKIIHQMRELARRSELHFTTVDINELVMESVEFLLPQLRLADVHVHLVLAEGLPTVIGDWVRLEQVLLNLLTNAKQAMDENKSKHIHVRTGRDEAADSIVFIEIRDTGRGFPTEESENLFKPFYTTKRPGEGTGLGLSISLRIIREHGGTIEAVSEQKKGSTFRIRLPLKPPEGGKGKNVPG
ncbi:MAG: PAS domain S-box protein [Spirochaetes bacterium]|nr:PAS domain S-box protein [Spirochaetota bacterium]